MAVSIIDYRPASGKEAEFWSDLVDTRIVKAEALTAGANNRVWRLISRSGGRLIGK